MKLLIVEDEIALLNSIVTFFEQDFHVCEQATTFGGAEQKIIDFSYDLIVLDIMLPGGNGLDIINIIKEHQTKCGIIVVSAKDALEDKIKGLNLGADDYLTKPFHLAELNSRINAVMRRNSYQGGDEKIKFNEILVDTLAKEVLVNNKQIILTQKEYELLLYLINNQNKIITKQSIAEHLWGDYMDMANNYDFIYTHIRNLRKKISEKNGKNYLKTIYGLGYKYTS